MKNKREKRMETWRYRTGRGKQVCLCGFLQVHVFLVGCKAFKYITNKFRFSILYVYVLMYWETWSDRPYDNRDHFTRPHSHPHKNGGGTDPWDFALTCTCNRIVVHVDNRTVLFKNTREKMCFLLRDI